MERLRSKLEKYMLREGLRSTNQRRLVTEVFFKSEGHLSVDELLAKVRAEDARVGNATVYRTLKLLKQSGVAHERHFGDGVARYEIAEEDDHHDHLICESCGKIVEFCDEEIERLQEKLAERHGFALSAHKHELYGECSDCSKSN